MDSPTPPTQDEAAVQEWARLQGLNYFDAARLADVSSLRGLVSPEDMQTFGVVPLALSNNTLVLGITDKTPTDQLPQLAAKLPDYQLGYAVVSVDGFSRIYNLLEIASFRPDLYDGQFNSFIQALSNAKQQDVFRLIVQLAYLMEASDIHIEPTGGEPHLRFRIDGILHPVTDIPKERYTVALSDVQTQAGMRWGGDKPQSGRVSEDVILPSGEKVRVNLRLETVPQFHGEEIVVRLFNFNQHYLSLNNLGLNEKQRHEISTLVSHPYGMVMVVGPTGSGKTSTLYAILNQVNNTSIKIVTLEDPVEYELPGITQIPVHTDEQASFADELRAVLREDPNIIMIGEIRDMDTAKTALQAALTGHLVLSTFHANTAASAITRLADMIGGEHALLASSLQLVVAQRLVRRLCPHCKKPDKLAATKEKLIREELGELAPDKLTAFKPTGCQQCQGLGYRGRVAILELLAITPELQKLISEGQSSAQVIEDLARQQGMHLMRQDGWLKVLEGLTSVDEVLRVT